MTYPGNAYQWTHNISNQIKSDRWHIKSTTVKMGFAPWVWSGGRGEGIFGSWV